jgi:hypothetical protein
MTPDSRLKAIPLCNGTFSYDESDMGRIKLWIRYNEVAPSDWEGKPSSSNSIRTYPQWVYNFDNEERAEDDLTDSTSSNGDLDNFYVTTDDTTPTTSQYVDLTVKARDSDNDTITDYNDTIKFKVYYRSSSSSSWTQTTSSTYYTMSSSYTNGYDFSSSNNGQKTFTNFIKFKKNNYDYKVRVYAEDDSSIYKEITFYVGSSSSSTSTTDNFSITAYPSSPSQDEYIDITVRSRNGSSVDNDYRGTVKFTVEKRANASSSWTTATTSYYTLARTSYTFTSSDNGEHTFSNLVRFRNDSYNYRLVITDDEDEDIVGTRIFSLNNDSSSSNGNNFYITADDTTPSTSQRVDLTVKARDDTSTDTAYRGTIQFEVYYKSSNSSTWTKTTSSTYYEMVSTYENNGYTFTSSNNGQKTFSNIIKFKKNNYSYKVLVYDEDDEDIEGYKIFTVGSVSSSSSSNVDGFTSSELNTVEGIYDARNDMIDNLKSRYTNLRNSSRRNTMSDDLYDEM